MEGNKPMGGRRRYRRPPNMDNFTTNPNFLNQDLFIKQFITAGVVNLTYLVIIIIVVVLYSMINYYETWVDYFSSFHFVEPDGTKRLHLAKNLATGRSFLWIAVFLTSVIILSNSFNLIIVHFCISLSLGMFLSELKNFVPIMIKEWGPVPETTEQEFEHAIDIGLDQRLFEFELLFHGTMNKTMVNRILENLRTMKYVTVWYIFLVSFRTPQLFAIFFVIAYYFAHRRIAYKIIDNAQGYWFLKTTDFHDFIPNNFLKTYQSPIYWALLYTALQSQGVLAAETGILEDLYSLNYTPLFISIVLIVLNLLYFRSKFTLGRIEHQHIAEVSKDLKQDIHTGLNTIEEKTKVFLDETKIVIDKMTEKITNMEIKMSHKILDTDNIKNNLQTLFKEIQEDPFKVDFKHVLEFPALKDDFCTTFIRHTIGLVCTFSLCYRHRTVRDIIEVLTVYLTRFPIPFSQDLIESFATNMVRIKKYIMGKDEEFHSQGPTNVVASFIKTLFNLFQNCLGISTEYGDIDKDSMTKLHGALTLVRDAASMCGWLGDALQLFISGVFYKITGIPLLTSSNTEVIEQAQKCLDKTNLLLSALPTEPLALSSASCIKVVQLTEEFNAVSRIMLEHKLNSTNFTAFFDARRKILDMYYQAKCHLKNQKGRPVPVGVIIMGAPDVGKSYLLEILMRDVAFHIRGYWNDSMYYPRKVENEYWEGYEPGMDFVEMDELFQSKNPEVITQQAQEWIYMVQGAPYHLHYANIEKKAGTFFSALMVGGSSNVIKFPDLGIIDPDAFFRRVPFLVEAEIDPHYVPNPDKIDDRSRYRMKLYTDARQYRRLGSKADYQYLTYLELAREIADQIKYNQKPTRILSHVLQHDTTDYLAQPGMKSQMDPEKILYEDEIKTPTTKQENLKKKQWDADQKDAPNLLEIKTIIHPKVNCHPIVTKAMIEAVRYFIPEYQETQTPMSKITLSCLPILLDNLDQVNIDDETSDALRKTHDVLMEMYPIVFCPGKMVLTPFDVGVYRHHLDFLRKEFLKVRITKNVKINHTGILTIEENIKVLDYCTSKDCWNKDLLTFHRDGKQNLQLPIESKYSEQFKDSMSSASKAVLKFKEEHPYLFYGGTIVGLGASMIAIKKYFDRDEKEDEFNTQSYQAHKKRHQVIKTETKGIQSGPVREMKAQSSDHMADAGQTALINSIVENAVEVNFVNGSDIEGPGCNTYFIKNRWLLMPMHLVTKFITGELKFMRFFIRGIEYKITQDKCRIFEKPGCDTILVAIYDKRVPEFKDISHHFIKEAELTRDFGAINVVGKMRGQVTVLQAQTFELTGVRSYSDDDLGTIYIVRGIKLTLATCNGHCGFLYLVLNPQMQRKILGQHVAGDGIKALGTVVTFEIIEELMNSARGQETPAVEVKTEMKSQAGYNSFPSHVCEQLTQLRNMGLIDDREDQSDNPDTVELGDNQIRLAKVKKQYKRRMIEKNNLRKSPIAEFLPDPKFLPSDLKFNRKDPRNSPLQLATLKNNKPNRTFSPEDASVIYDIMKIIASLMRHSVEKRKLTLHEAINGVPDWPHTDKCNTDSGNGWPFEALKENDIMEQAIKKGALVLIKGTKDQYRLSTQYQVEYDKFIAALKEGKIYPCIAVDTLKDELLPEEKVLGHRTRVFNVLAFFHYLAMRQYAGAFAEQYCRDWDLMRTASGLNPFSTQWQEVAEMLHIFDPDWEKFDGDFKTWDASIPSLFQWMVHEMVSTWYGYEGEDAQILYLLFLCTISTIHLCGNVLYLTEHGVVTGVFITSMGNSIMNFMVSMYVCYKIRQFKYGGLFDGRSYSHADYINHVRNMFGGDDNVHAQHKDKRLYTQEEFAWGVENFLAPMRYTSSEKDEVFRNKPGEQITFLKRKFRKEMGMVVCPLDDDVVDDMPKWINTTQPKELALYEKIAVALKEKSLSGRKPYEDFKTSINMALSKMQMKPVIATWADCLEAYRRGTFIDFLDTSNYVSQSDKTKVLEATRAPEQDKQAITVFEAQLPSNTAVEEVRNKDLYLMPYEQPGIKTVVERPYVFTVEWSSADAAGTELFEFDSPWDLIAASTNIKEKLSDFAHLVADLYVRIKVNCPKIFFGMLLVIWWPALWGSGPTDLYRASQYPSILISANTSQTGEFRIPFSLLIHYVDLQWGASDYPFAMGGFKVLVLNPLKTSTPGVSPVCSLSMFVNFENVQLGGYVPNSLTMKMRDYVPAARRRLDKKRKEELRMKSQCYRCENYKDKTVPHENCYFTRLQEEEKMAAQMDTALKVGAAVSSDKTTFPDEEKRVAATGPAGKFMQKADYVLHPLTQIPMVGKIAGAFIAPFRSLKRLFQVKGWDKPQDTGPVYRNMLYTTQNINRMSGTDSCMVLGLDDFNHSDNNPKLSVDNCDYGDFMHYKRLPGLIKQFTMDSTDDPDSIVASWRVAPMMCHTTTPTGFTRYHLIPCGIQGAMFVFSRGSMDYLIFVNTSLYTTAQIRITWIPSKTTIPSTIGKEGADMISKVYDINGGDNIIELKIPYDMTAPWMVNSPMDFDQTDDSSGHMHCNYNGTVIVSVINVATTGDVTGDSTIYFNVFAAAGNDMRFALPRPINLDFSITHSFTPPSLLEKQKQERNFKSQSESAYNLREHFKKEFPPLVPAKYLVPGTINMGEEVTSWYDLAHKYNYIEDATIPAMNTTYYAIVPGPSAGYMDNLSKRPLQLIRSLFFYYKGGSRYILTPKFNASTVECFLMIQAFSLIDMERTDGQKIEDKLEFGRSRPTLVHSTKDRRAYEFQIPYYSNTFFSPSEPMTQLETINYANIGIVGSDSTTMCTWEAGADDQAFFIPRAAPYLYVPDAVIDKKGKIINKNVNVGGNQPLNDNFFVDIKNQKIIKDPR